jgi:hypothetical protein
MLIIELGGLEIIPRRDVMLSEKRPSGFKVEFDHLQADGNGDHLKWRGNT